jgi:small GTP-binding protein
MSDDEYDDENLLKCKITLIGESSVGKTSFIKQYISETFLQEEKSTIGGEREYKIIEVNGEKIRLCFWDTAGQEKFRSLSRIFINKSNIVIFVYDITNKNSFEQIKSYWYPTTIEVLGKENVVYGIAANKSDLYQNEEVNINDAKNFAFEINAIYKETSAKYFESINSLINDMIFKFIEKRENDDKLNENNISVVSEDNEKKKNGCCKGKKIINDVDNKI